jgi:Tol biopolymer transport system component
VTSLRIAPNGLAAFAVSTSTGLQTTWKVDLGSGESHQFSSFGMITGAIDVSPNGQVVALCQRSGPGGASQIDIMSVADGKTLTHLAALDACVQSMRWTADGKELSYQLGPANANVWAQPIDGGPAHPLTHFNDRRTVLGWGWSPDGKLVVSRAVIASDIVLLTGVH